MTKYIVVVLEHNEDGANAETTHKLFDTYNDADDEISECMKCYDDGDWTLDYNSNLVLNKYNDQKYIDFTIDKVEV